MSRLAKYLYSQKKKTPYELLGISRTATKQEIKKAFINLTKKYHPDKNPDFKDLYSEINNAYQILSNELKRKEYDQEDLDEEEPFDVNLKNEFQGFHYDDYGSDWQFEDGENHFESVFRDYDDFFKFPESTYKQEKAIKGKNIILHIDLTFPEALNGSRKEITFLKKDVCTTCEGARSQPGTTPIKCKVCDCTGAKSIRDGNTIIKTECRNCNGKGYIIKHKCKKCEGEGTEFIEHSEIVDIPRGVRNGHEIRLHGKGNKGDHGGLRGDVSIVIRLVKDEYFQLDGYDVHVDHYISLSKSMLRGTETIETLDGEVKVQIPKLNSQNAYVKLEGKGLRGLHNEDVRGDFYIWFKVKIPEKISVEQMGVLKKIKELELNLKNRNV
jgi:molecular chaperone DnaJ